MRAAVFVDIAKLYLIEEKTELCYMDAESSSQLTLQSPRRPILLALT